MTKAKLTEAQSEWLRTRQAEDARAIAAHSATSEALAEAKARRDRIVREQDKLVAEAEARLRDATQVVVARLGPEGAAAVGITAGMKPKAGRPARPAEHLEGEVRW